MEYYRCENVNCAFAAAEEPEVCPLCGGSFFFSLPEEELTAANWNYLGSRAVDEERNVDALAVPLKPRPMPLMFSSLMISAILAAVLCIPPTLI